MSDKQPRQSAVQTKKMTEELVMAIADRVYGMLLRELKVERERQRLLNGPQRKWEKHNAG